MDTHNDIYKPHPRIVSESHVKSMSQFQEMYNQSIKTPSEFWMNISKNFHWQVPPTSSKVLDYNFDVRKGPIHINWFAGSKTNLCYNCLDVHIKNGFGEKVVFYWEGNDPDDSCKVTYNQLLYQVEHFGNALRSLGVGKGDRVAIYMPMISELVVAMLACARIGAIHSIIFGGFSDQAIADRIIDGKCKIVLTCDGVWRGGKLITLKSIMDSALNICNESGYSVSHCVVVRHLSPSPSTASNGENSSTLQDQPGKRPYSKLPLKMEANRDIWWHELMSKREVSGSCPVQWMEAEDPLFILYTSGSTGKPKGVLHTTAGYMLYAATTFKYVFDYQPNDIYWCTADIGWITGHSYVVYGPMLNGATNVVFEGIPTYPDPGRCWAVIDKYRVTKFYTAPTAIRTLIKSGDSFVTKYSRESLKVLGSVGEPINPDVWLWYYNIVGNGQCSIVDTFWQTETGGHVITPLPGATPSKPGSATLPFFGVAAAILDEDGKEIEGPGEGSLVFKKPWPGMMRTVYGNHSRFESTYFMKFPGYYCTADGARRDEDGYYWITGRVDDMLNVSGHLISTAQIESALVEHPKVAEAAVVGRPHEVKGECLYAFVTLIDGHHFNGDVVKELITQVRQKVGPFATPDFIQEAPALPKTRSGKIMRRVLRKIARNDHDLGDISTLADPSVVNLLFSLRPANA